MWGCRGVPLLLWGRTELQESQRGLGDCGQWAKGSLQGSEPWEQLNSHQTFEPHPPANVFMLLMAQGGTEQLENEYFQDNSDSDQS